MKRAIAIFVVLACILLMPNISSANVTINCSVQPETADYQRGFTYNIHLKNPTSSTQAGTVSLIVGPDYNNMDISKRWNITVVKSTGKIISDTVTVVIPADGFRTVTEKNVTFTDEELYKGEFRAWVEGPESTVEWNKTWYKCCFKSYTSETEICSEEKRGPILTSITELFRNDHTALNKTYKGLSFDYSIDVWANKEDSMIELEIYNNSSNDWEPKGIRSYTKPGYNQTLRWAGINLSYDDHFDDHLRGKYRFVGIYKTSSNIRGPVIEEKFYPLDVAPTQGTNTDSFNYSVTVNANICDKIMLQVKNHTSDTWDSKGTRDYVTPNINKTLTWNNIKLNIHELDQL
jgi:hypothetical protein